MKDTVHPSLTIPFTSMFRQMSEYQELTHRVALNLGGARLLLGWNDPTFWASSRPKRIGGSFQPNVSQGEFVLVLLALTTARRRFGKVAVRGEVLPTFGPLTLVEARLSRAPSNEMKYRIRHAEPERTVTGSVLGQFHSSRSAVRFSNGEMRKRMHTIHLEKRPRAKRAPWAGATRHFGQLCRPEGFAGSLPPDVENSALCAYGLKVGKLQLAFQSRPTTSVGQIVCGAAYSLYDKIAC